MVYPKLFFFSLKKENGVFDLCQGIPQWIFSIITSCFILMQAFWLASAVAALLNPILFLVNVKHDFKTGKTHQAQYIRTGYFISDLLAKLLYLKLLLLAGDNKVLLQKLIETLQTLIGRPRNAALKDQLLVTHWLK